MNAAVRRFRSERGESLLELIVAIAILGVCVVAIGAGVTLSIKISAIHHNQATADAFLHNYAETLQASYPACSGSVAPDYAAGLPTPSGFASPTATVAFWDKTAKSFNSTSCPATDPGLRQVTLNLTSTDGFVKESLVFVVRQQS